MLGKDSIYNVNIDFTGTKIAYVVSNEDPKCQERILVRVLGVHNLENKSTDNGVWANHVAPIRDASGDLPELGDYVYVTFPDKTNPQSILWWGFVRSSYQDGVDGTSTTVKPVHKEVENIGLSTKILAFIKKIF